MGRVSSLSMAKVIPRRVLPTTRLVNGLPWYLDREASNAYLREYKRNPGYSIKVKVQREKYKAKRNRQKDYASHVFRTYGLTKDRHAEMREAQNGLCAVCKERPCTHVDHCHKTGAIRGLLCGRCNVGLGFYEKYQTGFAAYLEAANGR